MPELQISKKNTNMYIKSKTLLHQTYCNTDTWPLYLSLACWKMTNRAGGSSYAHDRKCSVIAQWVKHRLEYTAARSAGASESLSGVPAMHNGAHVPSACSAPGLTVLSTHTETGSEFFHPQGKPTLALCPKASWCKHPGSEHADWRCSCFFLFFCLPNKQNK